MPSKSHKPIGGGISSLFVLKAIAAFCVVVIHYPLAFRYEFYPLIYTAVPLFFVITGYFLYKGSPDTIIASGKKQLCKAIRITLIASLVYYAYKIIISYISGGSFVPPFYSIYDVIIWILFGFNFSGPLWYMTALCWSLLIITTLYRLRWQKLLYLTPLAFVLFNVILAYPLRDISLPWYYETNFISSGLPWISVGMFIKKTESRIEQRVSTTSLWIIFTLTLVLRYIEQYLFVGAEPRALINVPLVIIIFILCLRYKSFGSNSIIAKLGRNHSTNIYLYHSLVGGFILFVCAQYETTIPDSICALIVYPLTLLLSTLIIRVKCLLSHPQ
ncbi:MAG: acyltransferase [Rikenellaceae bacterium]|nr:acyltransferase [Rikenellaceae bacterium]